jgi:hypothetical protein
VAENSHEADVGMAQTMFLKWGKSGYEETQHEMNQ